MSGESDWTPEEIQEAVDELVADLEKGEYDRHLRTIARAVFSRRDAIKGTSTVIVDHVPPTSNNTNVPVEGARKLDMHGNPVQAPQQVPAGALEFLTPGCVSALAKGRRLTTALAREQYFSRNGRRFKKSDVKGKAIRFSHNASPASMAGIAVLVTGIGDKAVQVKIIEEPKSKRGKYYGIWERQEKFFLTLGVIDKYLNFSDN